MNVNVTKYMLQKIK